MKLKIGDIISLEDEATRAAAVRDVERSALQVILVFSSDAVRRCVFGVYQSTWHHHEHVLLHS